MAGTTFSLPDHLRDLERASLHPLVCPLCREQYRQPCLLDCYHIFCARCLQGKASDNRLICPLCGYASVVKGINALPPEDCLLKFLLDDSADSVVQCANCDMEYSVQNTGPMYYCNTCSQPLCEPCREITHKARMFSSHDIVSSAKRAKDGHRKCNLHEELYIMFSTEKKSMLCIKCFRDMQVQSRTHCVDIETAYTQGCGMLDQAMLAVKELQASAREATVHLKAMIREVHTNVQEEETAICTLFNSMQEKLAERKRILLKAAQSQHEEKEKVLKDQLYYLVALLPTLQVHLVVCSVFLSLASKYDFLDMGYQLVDRLHRLVKLSHRLCPAQSSRIDTDFHAEFASCLDTLLPLGLHRSAAVPRGASGGSLLRAVWFMSCQSPSLGAMPQGSSLGYGPPASHRYACTKVLLAKDGDTPFAEHCRNYENSYRVLQTEVQNLKNRVQAMHRDLTRHHSLINTDAMEEILESSLHIDGQIASQYSIVQTHRTTLKEMWEETLQRVTNEQDIYEAQLHDLLQLKQENSYLTTIARQIGPYISSIAKVKERLEPRFQVLKEHEDDHNGYTLKIYEDMKMTTESPHGNDDGCSTIYKWDSNRNKNALILQADETLAKSTDYCWPSKQRNVSEMP